MRNYGFTFGLLAVVATVVGDPTGMAAAAGQWLGRWHGAQLCVMGMFLLSGLGLDADRARRGVTDLRTLAASLAVIFLAAPLLALLHGWLPLERGLWIGLALISVMPTTLSSGVVMVDLAGGNPASALMVTLTASGLAIFTIPPSLELLLGVGEQVGPGTLDKVALAVRLGALVVAPLLSGMALRRVFTTGGLQLSPRIGRAGQWLVLTVVWIAVSRSHETLQQAPRVAALSAALAVSFHGLLLLVAAAAARLGGLGKGRREVVWFMGAQKTLPIAVLLQTALFPEHGSALVFCVVHHVVHLAVDSC
ncbi:MAG: bile acid:sodium symporter, partial [Deferrisomatales bacterium]|nr:bile acid:sodium symporter [Deferrisomatales bacterium]